MSRILAKLRESVNIKQMPTTTSKLLKRKILTNYIYEFFLFFSAIVYIHEIKEVQKT